MSINFYPCVQYLCVQLSLLRTVADFLPCDNNAAGKNVGDFHIIIFRLIIWLHFFPES